MRLQDISKAHARELALELTKGIWLQCEHFRTNSRAYDEAEIARLITERDSIFEAYGLAYGHVELGELQDDCNASCGVDKVDYRCRYSAVSRRH